MTDDPFQHFGEQQRSYELLGEHKDALLAQAQQILQAHPQIEIVGLILDADASEAAAIRTAIEQATEQSHAGRGFLIVVPREVVVQILRANAPAALEWLPPSHGDSGHMLPLAAFTRGGVRFGAVPFPSET